MRIVHVAVKHPLFIVMLNLLIVVLGLISYQRLGLEESPQVDIPYVFLSVDYPGANPRTIEEQLLAPLESLMRSLPGLNRMTGKARNGGMELSFEFVLSVKSDQALVEVKDKLGQFTLPTGAKNLYVQKFSLNQDSILSVALSAEGVSTGAIMRYVKESIVPRLQQVPGVGTVWISGYREPELHVNINQLALNALNLTPLAVADSIRAHVVALPAGVLSSASARVPLVTQYVPQSLAQVQNLPLRTEDGRVVHIGDVAQITRDFSEQSSYSMYNGKPFVVMEIYKQANANLVQISTNVNKVIKQLQTVIPKKFSLSVIEENASFIENSLGAIRKDIVLGSLLAVLVVFCFLHDVRSTLVSAVAIPTSLVGTFFAMDIFHFTLNWMTLLALTISIGIFVDDAIVVIENTHRHLPTSRSVIAAVKAGTQEISLAAIAVTMTIVAVFVPVAFMEGFIGRFFLEFGLTVAVSVLISLFVALTIVPALSSRWLTYTPDLPKRPKHAAFIAWDKYYALVQQVYLRWLRVCLRHRGLVLAFGVGVFVLTAGLLYFVPMMVSPRFDANKASLKITLSDQTPFDQAKERAKAMESYIRKTYPGILSITTSIGGGFGQGLQTISFQFRLVDASLRAFTPEDFSTRLSADIQRFLKSPDEKTSFGGDDKALHISLFSGNDQVLANYANQVADFMNTLPNVHNATSAFLSSYEYRIVPDPVKAALAGVLPSDVAETVRLWFSSDSYVGKYNNEGNLENMRLVIADDQHQTLSNLLGVTVRRAQGAPVLLSSIASVDKVPVERKITHIDGLKQLSVKADYVGSDLGATVKKINAYIEKNHPLDVTYKLLGQSEDLKELSTQITKTLGLAVLFVFMVLASQFGNVRVPFVIVGSIPLCFSGAFLALLVTRQPLTLYALVGILLLVGLVAKNAILLLEFTQKSTAAVSVDEALVEAAGVRLRPILMTTLTMILGMLPMALGGGMGHEARTNMAVAVIGGLISSTALTLFIVPCFYSLLVHRKREFVRDL